VHRFNCRVHRRCWNSLNTSKFLTPLTSFVIFEAIILDRQPIITVISWTLIDYPLAAYQFSWMDLSNGQLSLFSNHRQVSPKRESVDSPMHLELNRLTFLLWHLGIHSSLTISNLWVIWGTLHDKPLLVLPGTKLDYSLKSSQLNREFITFSRGEMRTFPIPAPTPHDDLSKNIVHGMGLMTAISSPQYWVTRSAITCHSIALADWEVKSNSDRAKLHFPILPSK
jgi:hypothetical protein